MASEQLRVRAQIRFLTENEGGRTDRLGGPVSYRPDHDFSNGLSRDRAMGHIDLKPDEVIAPGDTIVCELHLLASPDLIKHIRKGRCWSICEEPQRVAIGTMLEVIPT